MKSHATMRVYACHAQKDEKLAATTDVHGDEGEWNKRTNKRASGRTSKRLHARARERERNRKRGEETYVVKINLRTSWAMSSSPGAPPTHGIIRDTGRNVKWNLQSARRGATDAGATKRAVLVTDHLSTRDGKQAKIDVSTGGKRRVLAPHFIARWCSRSYDKGTGHWTHTTALKTIGHSLVASAERAHRALSPYRATIFASRMPRPGCTQTTDDAPSRRHFAFREAVRNAPETTDGAQGWLATPRGRIVPPLFNLNIYHRKFNIFK